jgi:hypothetical protein
MHLAALPADSASIVSRGNGVHTPPKSELLISTPLVLARCKENSPRESAVGGPPLTEYNSEHNGFPSARIAFKE